MMFKIIKEKLPEQNHGGIVEQILKKLHKNYSRFIWLTKLYIFFISPAQSQHNNIKTTLPQSAVLTLLCYFV